MAEVPEIYRTIGENVTHYRREMGLTQNGLAKHAGMYPAQIANYEKGETRIQYHSLVDLANALGVRVRDLAPDVSEIEGADHAETQEAADARA